MRLSGPVLVLSAAVLAMAGWAYAEPADLLVIDLAKAGQQVLGPNRWGETEAINDRPCRLAKGGKDAWVQGPAWWKEGLRPGRGQYFLAEVRYKDTAARPIVFSVWGGLGGYESRSEMHRFGGLNDGKWKIAQIPLGWDMVMVRPGTRMVEFSILSKEGDVAVSSIRVLPLAGSDVPAAAERWNSETRAWVKQVQARSADGARTEFDKTQKASPAIDEGKESIVPYVRTWMSTIYPYSAPQEGETAVPLKARMARNEYEPATFGVYAPKQDLTNVTVKVEGLRHQSDPKAQLVAEVRTAEYAITQNKAGGLAVFPQRLWPMFATQIRKGQSGWFWVTFQSDPKTTPAGLYRGNVVITTDQGAAVLPVEVRVLPIQLVEMKDTDLLMGGCLSGLVSRHEMDDMIRHNHNQLQYWYNGVQPRYIVKEKGDFDLDFTVLDDDFEQARQAGMRANVYFLGGNPYGFPNTQHLLRDLAVEVLGMSKEQYKELMLKDPYNVPEQLVPLYKKWVAKVQAHARAKGWPEQIMSPFDEPAKWVQNREGTGKWIKPQFEQCCRFIHESAPGTRIYASIHHAVSGNLFLKDIDVFCSGSIAEDGGQGDMVRKAGKVFWAYTGIGNKSAAGLAHSGRYGFGFYFGAFDNRGALCWAYNSFNDRFDNTQGNNWGYAWYSPTDVIPAPYYEGVREAWDDRRYVETLRAVGKAKGVDVQPVLDEVNRTALKIRGKGGEDTVDDFWEQASEITVMDDLRGKIADRIIEISAAPSASRPARTAASSKPQG